MILEVIIGTPFAALCLFMALSRSVGSGSFVFKQIVKTKMKLMEIDGERKLITIKINKMNSQVNTGVLKQQEYIDRQEILDTLYAELTQGYNNCTNQLKYLKGL